MNDIIFEPDLLYPQRQLERRWHMLGTSHLHHDRIALLNLCIGELAHSQLVELL